MIIDKIKMRKIRFDVLQHLENEDFVAKIERVLDNKSEYQDKIEYLQSLLRDAKLDSSEKEPEIIFDMLYQYVMDYYNIETLNHSVMLDYINAIYELLEREDSDDEEFDVAEDKLECFLMQTEQIHVLESKMLDKVLDIMYLGEDNCVYDVATDTKLLDVKELGENVDALSDKELTQRILKYFSAKIINNQRELVTTFDFGDDGFYITAGGDDIFTEEEKGDILGLVNYRIKSIYNIEELENDSDNNDGIDRDDDFYIAKYGSDYIDEIVDNAVSQEDILSNIDDDVSVTKTEIAKESNERMNRLKDALKDSTNKITKR